MSRSPNANFRDFIPPPNHPRIANLDTIDIETYSQNALAVPEFKPLFDAWTEKLATPFVGITNDGRRREQLFYLADEGAPTEQIVAAGNLVIEALGPEEIRKTCHDIDAEEWRKWSNPEVLIHDVGIRLEKLNETKIGLIMNLLKASFSSIGYEKVSSAMKINSFLGEICNARPILNEYSYQFLLFGEPSETQPWGFSLTGHHVCLSVFILRRQMSISPVFLGAEPNFIDSGPWRGTQLLRSESDLALEFFQSLSSEVQSKAQIYQKMYDPSMPSDRLNFADQRHLGGAFQDNRLIPYEGIRVIDLKPEQQSKISTLVGVHLRILPDGPFAARMQQFEEHMDETFFSWIGGFGDDDPFYYRVQSPVIMIELDHHSGVFLLNQEPAKYHVHTIIRTPNGNDYGKEWLKLFRKQQLS